MQDERGSIQRNDEYAVSQRTQHLIKYLEKLWQRPHEPSSEALKRITDFIVNLPEPYQVYQAMAITKIAESLVNNMSLHFLDIMATFQQKAEQEGIDSDEREATLNGVMTESFPEIMGLNRHIFVRSIDDLVTLSNITLGLYTLSQVDTAEEAQSWMYELPVLYRRQLAQEHLVTSIQAQLMVTKGQTTTRSGHTSGYISWNSSLPDPVQVSSKTNRILPTLA